MDEASIPLVVAIVQRLQPAYLHLINSSYFFALLAVFAVSLSIFTRGSKSNVPLLNAPAWWQPKLAKVAEWMTTSEERLAEGRTKSKGKPFRAITEIGDLIVLPNRYAQEIRNEFPTLNFRLSVMKGSNSHIKGLEALHLLGHESEIVQRVVRKQLTKQLNSVSVPLSAECTHAINIIFGETKEWQELKLREPILNLIARISSRVFLGEELCRHPRWLALTVDYTVTSFAAGMALNMFPGFLRPLVAVFEPNSRQARASMREGRQLIGEVIKKRRQKTEQAAKEGRPKPVFDDAITWAEDESKGARDYDAAQFQLMLSFAAIHTTSDLVTQTLMNLASQPHLIQPLRQEMIEVLGAEGLKKSALYNLKLLDSAIKEAQRLKPPSLISMRRIVSKKIELSDGLVINKGDHIAIEDYARLDPAKHKDPETFNIYRFRNMREQPGGETKAQLVSTHPDHLAFGHGYHACPGRFFASNEIKIALCHLLLKYDWELAPGAQPRTFATGTNLVVDPELRVMCKRRQEEIDLEKLAV